MLSNQSIKDFATRLGFDLAGICSVQPPPHYDAYRAWVSKSFHGTMEYLEKHVPVKADPRNLLPSARSIIAVGLNYYQPIDVVEGQPKIARYALGRDYHKVIRSKLRQLRGSIAETHPDAEFRVCVDSAPLMERDYAQLAGLGWFGKNTLLINSQRGSWFLLGFLLTSLELEPDSPAVGGCGTCRACIDACPTGAIVQEDGKWQVDARACISYLTIEHRGEISGDTAGWTFGCDICQEVCPFNQPRSSQPLRAQPTTEPDFLNRRRFPSLVELAQIQPEEWERLSEGSPIRRTGMSGIQRNARHNLTGPKTPPPSE